MRPIFESLGIGIKSLIRVIFHPVFWLVLLLVIIQYKKQTNIEKKILGIERNSVIGRTFQSIFYGLLGGFLGSTIMIIVGVSIGQEGLIYLLPIALLLYMIKSRYLCFSYAGGLLSLSSLIFGFPKVDVEGLMALVAILHFIESFLIYLDGNTDSIPIIIDKGNGQHIGGYNLQRIWPIPIIIMTLMASNQVASAAQIEMPNWWPLIKPFGYKNLNHVTFIMISVVAVLGYGDIALTQLPKIKVKKSAFRLLNYSILLLVLSILASRMMVFQWIAALFAPTVHELIILIGQKEERKGKPLFTLPKNGIRVLEVLEGSAADKMKIQRGDILYSINNIPVNAEEELIQVLNQWPTFVWIQGEDYRGEKYTKELKVFPYGLRTLGIIVLPQYSDITYVMQEKESILERIISKIRE